jgi:hypothetical protein
VRNPQSSVFLDEYDLVGSESVYAFLVRDSELQTAGENRPEMERQAKKNAINTKVIRYNGSPPSFARISYYRMNPDSVKQNLFDIM